MVDILLSILIFLVGIVLGFYLLLLGRRTMVLTTAIVCLAGASGLLALIFLNENSGWALAQSRDWLLLGISVAAGIIGGLVGGRNKHIAGGIIGFFAGGYIGLWFYDIAHYLIVNMAHWSEQLAFWVGVAILIATGLVGLFFTWRSEAVAVILISVFVGADLVTNALGLDPTKSITAVIALSLALLGLVVQYAQYLRETRADTLAPFGVSTGPAPAPEFFDLSDD